MNKVKSFACQNLFKKLGASDQVKQLEANFQDFTFVRIPNGVEYPEEYGTQIERLKVCDCAFKYLFQSHILFRSHDMKD